MAFVQKSVNPTGHVGADLKDLRERAGWSRADVSGRLKFPESVVRALEEEDWAAIPDAHYVERMLRAYVDFLGGNQRYFLEKYRAGKQTRAKPRCADEFLPRRRQVGAWALADATRILTMAGFALAVLGLGGYVYAQARAISSPPPLTVLSPEDGARVTEPFVLVRGTTLADSSVLVNGQPAAVAPDGSFQLQMEVPRGVTTITVEAKKRHGQEAQVTRRVMYDRPLPADISLSSSTASQIP